MSLKRLSKLILAASLLSLLPFADAVGHWLAGDAKPVRLLGASSANGTTVVLPKAVKRLSATPGQLFVGQLESVGDSGQHEGYPGSTGNVFSCAPATPPAFKHPKVGFVAEIAFNPDLMGVQLFDVTEPSEPVLIGDMTATSDFVFELKERIRTTNPGTRVFQAEASYAGGATVLSSPVEVVVSPKPFSKVVSSAAVQDFGSSNIVVNRLAVTFDETVDEEQAGAIAESVGAILVGFSKRGQIGEFEFPAIDVADPDLSILEEATATLLETEGVTGVSTIPISGVEGTEIDVDFDSVPAGARRTAFETAHLPQAWDLIETQLDAADLQAKQIEIGVIDQGLDTSHYELDPASASGKVNLLISGTGQSNCILGRSGLLTASACSLDLTATNHGTAVVGILAANNRSAFGGGSRDANETNGVMAGVGAVNSAGADQVADLGSATSMSGSRVDYRIHFNKVDSFTGTEIATFGGTQLSNGAKIVLLAQGAYAPGALSTSPNCSPSPSTPELSASEFTTAKNNLVGPTGIITQNPDVLFIASAGNCGVPFVTDGPNAGFDPVPQHLPGGLVAPNLITVTGTTANGAAAGANSNVLPAGISGTDARGAGLNLIAAPGDQVFAPLRSTGSVGTACSGTTTQCKHWGFVAGTSAAASIVTGVAGLIHAASPTAPSPAVTTGILLDQADSAPASLGGRLVNAERALHNVLFDEVDVVFLVDTSGSFSGDIEDFFKVQAPDVLNALEAQPRDYLFGLAEFQDFPFSPFGGSGDIAFRQIRALAARSTAPSMDTEIAGLTTGFGGDGPESQQEALYQLATGLGRDVPPAGASAGDIPAANIGFRTSSDKVIVLWTDALFHEAGDPGDISYPGASFADTCQALGQKGINVIGIFGSPEIGATDADLRDVVICSGGTLPNNVGSSGIACGSGVSILPGEEIVCPISAEGDGIGTAILAVIEGNS